MALATLTRPEPNSWRKAASIGWVSVWLVFLGSPLERVWHDNSNIGRTAGTAALLAFAALYLTLFITARLRWRAEPGAPRPSVLRLRLMLAALAGLVLVAEPFAGSGCLTMVVYVGAAAMFTFRPNIGVFAVLALAVGAEISSRSVPGWESEQWSASFSILFAGAAVYATRLAFGRSIDLMAAREEMAQMAVEEERSRMTRDLHDILGHSLTVITIKAELAGRLMGTNEARASAEIADIERLAREALSDVRTTIAGRREVSLAPELVNARGALAAANIDADVPNAVDDVPAVNRELFGWTVREGVTNVLRHSKAAHCEILLSGTSVEIHDDGVGSDGVDPDGNGLQGLRQRAANAGASILTGTSPRLGGFLLRVSTPTPGGTRD